MSDPRFGHFGLPALLLAGCALLALVLHLAVPYAHVNPKDEGTDSFVLDRGEAADFHDDFDLAGPSSPALTLAGSITLLAAAAGLVVCGYLPLTVTAGRWLGWGLAAVASAGGLMAFISSALWVGSGLGQAPQSLYGSPTFGGGDFGGLAGLGAGEIVLAFGGVTGGLTGLLELIGNTDYAARVIVISPLLVAALTATALVCCTRIAGNVVSLENGYRERAQQHLSAANWALLTIAIVAIVPWSIGKIEDYEGQGDTDYFYFGAHTVLNSEKASDEARFDGLAYSINVLLALGWVGFALSFLGSLGGVLASVGAPAPLARAAHFTLFGTAFMLLWGAVCYVLAWSYQWRPGGTSGFQPGYFPVLLAPVLVFWALRLVAQVRQLLATRAAATGGSAAKTVRFD